MIVSVTAIKENKWITLRISNMNVYALVWKISLFITWPLSYACRHFSCAFSGEDFGYSFIQTCKMFLKPSTVYTYWGLAAVVGLVLLGLSIYFAINVCKECRIYCKDKCRRDMQRDNLWYTCKYSTLASVPNGGLMPITEYWSVWRPHYSHKRSFLQVKSLVLSF